MKGLIERILSKEKKTGDYWWESEILMEFIIPEN